MFASEAKMNGWVKMRDKGLARGNMHEAAGRRTAAVIGEDQQVGSVVVSASR